MQTRLFASKETPSITSIKFWVSCLSLLLVDRTASSANEKRKSWHSLLRFHRYFERSLSLQLVGNLSGFIIFARAVPFTAVSRCTFFTFPKQITFFSYTMIVIAMLKTVLLYTEKDCRAVCKGRVPTALQRWRSSVQCLAELKKSVSLLKKMSCTCKKATKTELWSSIQSFWVSSWCTNVQE